MSEQLKKRSDIPKELTWDLTHIFADETAYEDALAACDRLTTELENHYKEQIANMQDAEALLQMIKQYESLITMMDKTGTYAYLAMSVDMTDDAVMKRYQKMEATMADLSSRTSFVNSELMEVSDALLADVITMAPPYASFIKDIIREKKHRLHPETERVLKALSPSLQLPYTIYEQSKHADMDFGTFEVDGKTYPLSFVLFENEYNLEADTEIRRKAFDQFSDTLKKYENTVATAYNAEVQRQKTMSRLRGYDSVLDYLLDEQKVDRSLYNRQIDRIMQDLAPHMRRYATLLQKAYNLDEMTFADLKVSLDPAYDPKVSIEESKAYISEGLRVLGDEYHDLVMRAYDERWVDFAENKGKSTGGFCASPYQIHGYILLSWTGRLSEVFTLAHELGHAAHFSYAHQENPLLACEPSLYFVEAPSTCNEMFLTHSLLRKNDDSRFQRWVLASMIQNTYYHNFVTHLLEAAFQREVYQRVDDGQFLQAADFNAIKKDVLTQFWGDAVVINEGAERTWMRQPHYYMGLYSYTYSAGLTIATEASRRVLEQGETAVQDWIAALKAGGTVSPVEFAQMAGVDITTDQPLSRTIAYIGEMIDKIELLSD